MENKLSLRTEIKTLIGRCIVAGDKTIYPIARLSILKTADMSVQSFCLSPLALVIISPEFKEFSIISLTCRE